MLTILVFVAVALVGAGIALAARDYFVTRRQAINERLGLAETDSSGRFEGSQSRLVTTTDSRATNGDWFERLVLASGLQLSPEAALLLSLLVGIAVGGVLFLWRDQFWLAVCGMAVGMLLVIIFLMFRRSQRTRAIQEQLPGAVSLLSRSVHAGESLEHGLELVAQHTDEPLAGEFRHCAMQFDMGLSVEATMRALTRRVPLAEMQILASALIVQRRAGGHLAETLDTLVLVLRDRINYQRHFRATTAASRISALVIGIGGPLIALGMWIWQPQYLNLLTSSQEGRTLLLIAVVLYIVGLLWALRLLRPVY